MADRPAADFGFKRDPKLQFADALAWQRQAPTSRWLLVEGEALPACALIKARARDMGNANRRRWWLLDISPSGGCRRLRRSVGHGCGSWKAVAKRPPLAERAGSGVCREWYLEACVESVRAQADAGVEIDVAGRRVAGSLCRRSWRPAAVSMRSGSLAHARNRSGLSAARNSLLDAARGSFTSGSSIQTTSCCPARSPSCARSSRPMPRPGALRFPRAAGTPAGTHRLHGESPAFRFRAACRHSADRACWSKGCCSRGSCELVEDRHPRGMAAGAVPGGRYFEDVAVIPRLVGQPSGGATRRARGSDTANATRQHPGDHEPAQGTTSWHPCAGCVADSAPSRAAWMQGRLKALGISACIVLPTWRAALPRRRGAGRRMPPRDRGDLPDGIGRAVDASQAARLAG